MIRKSPRSRADWLVGMNLSRAYSLWIDDALSVGRVQTPTLAMLVEGEQAIRSFVPEPYHEVHASFGTEPGSYAGLRLEEEDWYVLSVPAQHELRARIAYRSSRGDLDLALYHAEGALVSRSRVRELDPLVASQDDRVAPVVPPGDVVGPGGELPRVVSKRERPVLVLLHGSHQPDVGAGDDFVVLGVKEQPRVRGGALEAAPDRRGGARDGDVLLVAPDERPEVEPGHLLRPRAGVRFPRRARGLGGAEAEGRVGERRR